MKSNPDLLGNTERSSVTPLPPRLSQVELSLGSMSHCEAKMAAAVGPEQHAPRRLSGYLSECCPHDTVPLRCHFKSPTG